MKEKRSPPKIARFMVWLSAAKDNREDILITFDEMFDGAVEEFGVIYGYAYAWSQAVRSLPYGAAALTLKIISFFVRLGS